MNTPPVSPPAARLPRILITAGPTHEPIDAVRYLANRSSGRMGFAIARAAIENGWPTTLLLGPTSIQPPQSSLLATFRFQTAADLQALLARHWPDHDALFMAAAVADYTPAPDPVQAAESQGKLRRDSRGITLKLLPTPDLLAGLAAITRPGQIVIGFALEPAGRLLDSAREKLARKRLDAIVANPLETMDSPTISGTILFADGSVVPAAPNLTKEAFATWLVGQLKTRLTAHRA